MLTDRQRIPVKDIILIGLLPNFLKKIIYRLKGYDIGKGVKIGFGSVIIAKNVRIGNNTKIGHLTIIRSNNIKIGSHVSIGTMTIFNTPHFEIGDGSVINDQVFVGGPELPESKLILGKNTIIMQWSYVNTTHPIVIGDDSGVGGHCLLFTHGSWLSKFEGYPVQFGSIEIGNSVWLPWRIFVMPGTKIGHGSVIGANSLVSGEIPSKSFAAGSPAKIIRKAPDFPKIVSENDKILILQEILAEMIRYLEFYGISCQKEKDVYEIKSLRKRWLRKTMKVFRMKVCYDNEKEEEQTYTVPDYDLLLSLKPISDRHKQFLISNNCMWIDIEKKEKSCEMNDFAVVVTNFLERYGVRLTYAGA